MKKILLTSIAFIAIFAFVNKAKAQCTIAQSSVLVNIRSIVSEPGGGCTTTFDLTFDLAGNGGNKWSHIHLWDASAYPGIAYVNGTGPNRIVLNGGSFPGPTPVHATVSLDYHLGTNAVSSNYPPDANVNVETAGVTYTRTLLPSGETRFSITNITAFSNNCNPLNLLVDVWSAQDNQGKNIACGVTGLQVRGDEPQVRGQIICSDPRTYSVSFQTKTTRNITWTVYRDVAPFGVFDASDEANIVDGPRTESNDGDPAGLVFDVHGPYSYTGGEVAGNRFNIWIKASASGTSNNNIIYVDNTCAALPVNLTAFTAKRSNASTVTLGWVTAQEINASGFEIQRQLGNGSWQVVGFVPTQAFRGNSSSPLTYSYLDNNNTKGISQYRLRAVDIDGQSKFSEIRSVRGFGQVGKTIVFPNPSSDGKLKVVFEDMNGTRDVSLTDMTGRLIKQWNSITNNHLQIDNLTPGIYSLRVIVRETGEQSTEKIIVNNR